MIEQIETRRVKRVKKHVGIRMSVAVAAVVLIILIMR